MLRIYILCLIISGYCFGADGEETKACATSFSATVLGSTDTQHLLGFARDALFTPVPKDSNHPNFKDAGDSFITLVQSMHKFYGIPLKKFKILPNSIRSDDENSYSKDPITVSNLYIQSALLNYVISTINSRTPVELSKTVLKESFSYTIPLYIQLKEYASDTHVIPSRSPLFKILMLLDQFNEEKSIEQLISHTLDYIKLQKSLETLMTNIANQWGFEYFSPFVTQTELDKDVVSETSEFFLNIAESSERFKKTSIYKEMFKSQPLETVMTSSIQKMTREVRLEFSKLILIKKAMLLDVVSILEEMQHFYENQLYDLKTGEFLDLFENPREGSIRAENRRYFHEHYNKVHGLDWNDEDEDDGVDTKSPSKPPKPKKKKKRGAASKSAKDEDESARAGGGGRIGSVGSPAGTPPKEMLIPLAQSTPKTADDHPTLERTESKTAKEDETPWVEVGKKGDKQEKKLPGAAPLGKPKPPQSSSLPVAAPPVKPAKAESSKTEEDFPHLPQAAPVSALSIALESAVDRTIPPKPKEDDSLSTESSLALESDSKPKEDKEEKMAYAATPPQTVAVPLPIPMGYPIPVSMLSPYSRTLTPTDIMHLLVSEGFSFPVTMREPGILTTLDVTVKISRERTTFNTSLGLFSAANRDLIQHNWQEIISHKIPGTGHKVISSSLPILDIKVGNLRGLFTLYLD
jgi:hypothetical protein